MPWQDWREVSRNAWHDDEGARVARNRITPIFSKSIRIKLIYMMRFLRDRTCHVCIPSFLSPSPSHFVDISLCLLSTFAGFAKTSHYVAARAGSGRRSGSRTVRRPRRFSRRRTRSGAAHTLYCLCPLFPVPCKLRPGLDIRDICCRECLTCETQRKSLKSLIRRD